MNTLTDAAFPCPVCKAKQGEHCGTVNGTQWDHGVRIDLLNGFLRENPGGYELDETER